MAYPDYTLLEKLGILEQKVDQADVDIDIEVARPNHGTMNTPSREEFEARMEAAEARMDKRVTEMQAAVKDQVDSLNRGIGQQVTDLTHSMGATFTRLENLIIGAEKDRVKEEATRSAAEDERRRTQEERDKRIDLLVASAAKSAEQAGTLKANMWLASLTVVVAVVGTVIAAYYATQSSNIGMSQTVIAAFQQGQQNPPAAKPDATAPVTPPAPHTATPQK